jgi:hypothetical protein
MLTTTGAAAGQRDRARAADRLWQWWWRRRRRRRFSLFIYYYAGFNGFPVPSGGDSKLWDEVLI